MCGRFSPQISSFEVRFASSIVIVKTGRAGYGEVQTARTSVMIGLSSAGFFHTRLRHICIIQHERRDNEEGGQDQGPLLVGCFAQKANLSHLYRSVVTRKKRKVVKGRLPKKETGKCGNFKKNGGGGGLPQSHFHFLLFLTWETPPKMQKKT